MQLADIRSAYFSAMSRDGAVQLYQQLDLDNPDPDRRVLYRGGSPVHFAARYVDHPAVQFLLERAVDTSPDEDGRTPLHYLAESDDRPAPPAPGDIGAVTEALLDAGVSALRKDSNGQTCYHEAALHANAELLETLAGRGVRLTLTDSEGNTGLHLACSARGGDRPRTIRAFLSAGVDPDVKNNMAQTAKDIAIANGDKQSAALLSGVDEAAADPDATPEQAELRLKAGGMSLHQAVYRQDAEAIAALLALGADPNEISDDHDSVGGLAAMTPLGLAVRSLDVPSIAALLAGGAEPDFKNDQGRTAICYLFSYDTDVRLLGKAFQEHAVDKAVALLSEHGCDLNAEVTAELDTLCCFALRTDYGSGWLSRTTYTGLVIDTLIKLGVDVNKANRLGGTPLMYCCAADLNDVEDVQLSLLEAGADVSAKDDSGATALHYVARRTYPARPMPQLAELLFDFGDPEVSAVDNTGQTALEIATEKQDDALVKLLLGKM
jgi:ankyrin repeat protein